MKSPSLLRLGTRGSLLALAQAASVQEALQKKYPDLVIEIVTIKTSGDRYKGERVADAGGKGLFVKEIEEALLKKEIDFALHSLKDLPGFLRGGLTIACFPKREDPRDCLVSLKYKSFRDLPRGAVIGTGSPRRAAQILSKRPDLKVKPIRGNVDTRLKKLQEEDYDGLILAAAGLKRLKKEEVILEYFEPEFFVPAIGQGILAIETRKEDVKLNRFLKDALEDKETALAARAERAFLKKMGGDCYTPMGAYAFVRQGEIQMTGWFASLDGKREIRLAKKGKMDHVERIGETLAKEILDAAFIDKASRSM